MEQGDDRTKSFFLYIRFENVQVPEEEDLERRKDTCLQMAGTIVRSATQESNELSNGGLEVCRR